MKPIFKTVLMPEGNNDKFFQTRYRENHLTVQILLVVELEGWRTTDTTSRRDKMKKKIIIIIPRRAMNHIQ
jgi:hypothetical protein